MAHTPVREKESKKDYEKKKQHFVPERKTKLVCLKFFIYEHTRD